jgi:hypothetical protein
MSQPELDWERAGVCVTCGARGDYAVIGLVPDGELAEPLRPGHEGDPVLAIVSACKPHLRAVKKRLKEVNPYLDDPAVCTTDYLRQHWDEVMVEIDPPKLVPLRVTT